MASMIGDIPSHWPEIQGEGKWKGLLDPLDNDLRRSLLVYGNLARATVDAFEKDESSPHYGDCPFEKDSFFQKVYLEKGNPYKYKVTKYIYATSSFPPTRPGSPIVKDQTTSWMGYVAVTTEEGARALGRIDVVVVWRGTITPEDLKADEDFNLVPYSELGTDLAGSEVHRGFHSVYTTAPNEESSHGQTSARCQVLEEIRKLVGSCKEDDDISITVTGHSLGAALATLNSIDIVARRHNIRPNGNSIRVTAVGFGTPRVGNHTFTDNYDKMENLSFIKVRNLKDPVPNLPFSFLCFPYSECGAELVLDAGLSPYLKECAKYLYAHNLELYLHGVAGTNGLYCKFCRDVERIRDIALVNKEIDGLLDNYNIPVGWWPDTEPIGMEQWDDGSWHPVKSEVLEPTTESST